jgi:hypothetical protein
MMVHFFCSEIKLLFQIINFPHLEVQNTRETNFNLKTKETQDKHCVVIGPTSL